MPGAWRTESSLTTHHAGPSCLLMISHRNPCVLMVAPGPRVSLATDAGIEASPHGSQSQRQRQPACGCVTEAGHGGAVSHLSLGTEASRPQRHL